MQVAYDSIGRRTFSASLACLERRGLLVSFGNASGPPPPLDVLSLSTQGSLFVTRPTLFDYVATLKLTPVTDGNRCFGEWSAEFDCAEVRERELTDTIGGGVFQGGFDALKRHFGRR